MARNKTKCLFSKLQMCHYFNFTKPEGVPHATGNGNKAARKILEYFYGFLYNFIVDISSHHFITISLNLSPSLFRCCYCCKIDKSCMFWIEGMCVCEGGNESSLFPILWRRGVRYQLMTLQTAGHWWITFFAFFK